MCGISGYISNQGIQEDVLTLMRDELIHRGPDGFGNYISDDFKVGLSHRRLSIVDLSEGGAQPMHDTNSDYVITYNGEVYNHVEIRKELESLGYKFKGKSDTEVVLNAYIQWGENCLDKFNGMFAFVIYNKTSNLLFIARDRFGIKPLYYSFLKNGDFAFASELKAIVRHPSFKKEMNISAMADYFKYRYIPSPKTIWNDVFKLEHAHYAVYDIQESSLVKVKYYDLYEKIKNKTSTLKDVEYLLNESVKMQMMADVEVGTFLSGGMDSSSIALLAKQNNPNVKSFSMGFEPIEYSELGYSKEVAEHLNTEHITSIVNNLDDTIIDEMSFFYDEPLADSSCVPTYILSELTSKHLKVVLSGDGGDEVFSGYNWYNSYLLDYNSYTNSMVTKIKMLFNNKSKNHINNFEEYYNKLLLGRFDKGVMKEMFPKDIYSNFIKNDSNLMEKFLLEDLKSVRAVQNVDLNTFMVDDILVKVDRATMAHSIESRIPLLDHKLVEAVLSLPENVFPSSSTGKPVLKNMMEENLPDVVFNRKKQGFSAPVTDWPFFKKEKNKLKDGYLVKNGYLNYDFIEGLLNNDYNQSDSILWMIFILERWAIKWLK